MKKIMSVIVAVLCFLSSVLNVLAFDKPSEISEINSMRENIRTLTEQCVSENIPVDYENAAMEIVNRYESLIKSGRGDTEYILDCLRNICCQTEKKLTAYLNGEEIARSVPKYSGGHLDINDTHFQGDVALDEKTEQKPVFLGGVGHWKQVRKDLDFFSETGLNFVQTEISMSEVLREPCPADDWIVERQLSDTTEILQTDKTASSGTKSLFLRDENTDWSVNKLTAVHQKVLVKPNTKYQYSFMIKRKNATNFWFSLKGISINETLVRLSTTDDKTGAWERITGSYTTGESETSLDFTFVNELGAEEIYIDSAILYESGTNANLLKNPSFENLSGVKYGINTNALEELYAFLKEAELYHIKVDLLISTHNAPGFVAQFYPELKYSGYGFFDYDPLMPKSREMIQAYVSALSESIKDCSSIHSICLSNEPSFISAYQPETYNPQWREWLLEKYTTIEALNDGWNVEYTDFSQCDLKEINEIGQYNSMQPMYYDYKSFNEELFCQWHTWLGGTIKSILPNVYIHCKEISYTGVADTTEVRSQTFNGVNFERFRDFSDINGSDFGVMVGSKFGYEATDMWCDLLSSIQKAPSINSEAHIVGEDSADGAQSVYTSLWQNSIHGMGAQAAWTWDNQIEYAKGEGHYDALLNLKPEHYLKLSNATMDLNRLCEEITSLQNAPSRVGVLYSEASRVYSAVHMNSVFNTYRALCYQGEKVHFVTDTNLEEPESLELLIIPEAECVTDEVFSFIKDFKGQLIILGEDSLSKNEYNKKRDINVVSDVKSRARIVPTSYSGLYMTSPNDKDLADVISDELMLSNIFVREDKTNDIPLGVSWMQSTYRGKAVLNICNYTKKPVSLKIVGGAGAWTNRIDEQIMSDVILAQPGVPVLLEQAERTVDTLYPIDPIIKKNNGTIRISWKNPKEKFDLISLFINGELIDNNWDISAGAINALNISDCNSDENCLKLIIQRDGIGYPYYFSANKNEAYNKTIGDNWTVDDANLLAQYRFSVSRTAHCGNHSLYFTENDSNWDNRAFLYYNKSKGQDFEAGCGYEVSFWYKCDKTANMQLQLGDKVIEDANIWFLYPTDEWKKKTFYFTDVKAPTTFAANNLALRYIIGSYGLWIDDVEVYKLNDSNERVGENLISGGDFEEQPPQKPSGAQIEPLNGAFRLTMEGEAEVSLDGRIVGNTSAGVLYVDRLTNDRLYQISIKAIDKNNQVSGSALIKSVIPTAKAEKPRFYPINPIIKYRNGYTAMSWKNPDNKKLKNVSVYSVIGEEEALLSGSISATPNDYCFAKAPFVENAYYRIVMEFEGFPKTDYLLSGTGYTDVNNVWRTEVNNTANSNVCYQYTNGLTEDAHSGKYAFAFHANYKTYDGSYVRLLPENGQTIKTEEGKTYRVSAWIKADEASSVKCCPGGLDSFYVVDRYANRNNEAITKNGWMYFYRDITATATLEQAPSFVFDEMADEICLDDFSIYELDENQMTVGENLILDGGFEDVLEKKPAPVTSVAVSTNESTINVSWSNPDDADFLGTNVYLNGDKVGQFSKDTEAFSLNTCPISGGVINVKSVNAYGREEFGTLATIDNSFVEIYQNGELTKTIKRGEDYHLEASRNLGIIYASCYEKGRLIDVKMGEQIDFNIPANADCMKVLLWNQMKPLSLSQEWEF